MVACKFNQERSAMLAAELISSSQFAAIRCDQPSRVHARFLSGWSKYYLAKIKLETETS